MASQKAARPTTVITGESTAVSEQLGSQLDTTHNTKPINAQQLVADTLYEASPIKRFRSTKDEVQRRWQKLYDIVAEQQPMTVRQVFYQASSVHRLVDKSEDGYSKIGTDLGLMRKAGKLPYQWIADNTRWQRKPATFSSPEEALTNVAKLYRKALWDNANAYVEIWLEKDALSGVVYPITEMFDVPLMVARGYASLSFHHSAAEHISRLKVPAYIYHFGDFDPSGVDAARSTEKALREMAPGAEIHFERVSVTQEQIDKWNLPTRPTKQSDTRAKKFGKISVELDAIKPSDLRELVQAVIEKHLPKEQYEVLKVAEESERKLIKGIVGLAAGGLRGQVEATR